MLVSRCSWRAKSRFIGRDAADALKSDVNNLQPADWPHADALGMLAFFLPFHLPVPLLAACYSQRVDATNWPVTVLLLAVTVE